MSKDTGKKSLETWPARLSSPYLYLERVSPEHVQALWPQLADLDNAHLYDLFFGHACSTARTLQVLFEDEMKGRSGMLSYAVYLRQPIVKLLGWMTMYASKTTSDLLEVAVFLPREARAHLGARSFFLLCVQAFEESGLRRINFRHGRLVDHNTGKHFYHDTGALGMSYIAVLGRQLFLRDVTDVEFGVITAEQWPAIKLAGEAWEASNSSMTINDKP